MSGPEGKKERVLLFIASIFLFFWLFLRNLADWKDVRVLWGTNLGRKPAFRFLSLPRQAEASDTRYQVFATVGRSREGAAE